MFALLVLSYESWFVLGCRWFGKRENCKIESLIPHWTAFKETKSCAAAKGTNWWPWVGQASYHSMDILVLRIRPASKNQKVLLLIAISHSQPT